MANYYKKSSETIVLIDVDYEKLGSLCNGIHPWNAQEELKHLGIRFPGLIFDLLVQ